MFENADFAKISSSKIKTNRSVGAAYISLNRRRLMNLFIFFKIGFIRK